MAYNKFKKNKKTVDNGFMLLYHYMAVSEQDKLIAVKNLENLRLNSTHNPENSHVFLNESERKRSLNLEKQRTSSSIAR